MREAVARCERFLTREHGLIGASLARISLGLCTLLIYVLHYRQRWFLWGPEGAVPLGRPEGAPGFAVPFSIYRLSTSPAFFEAVYHLGILAALLLTIGWRTRLSAVLNFVCVWSLQFRNEYITDGGDNIARLLFFYMLFVNQGAYFSVDRDRRRVPPPGAGHRLWREARAMLHNAAMAMVVFQLGVVYLVAGMHKVSGSLWQSGTALYYVMQVPDFSWSPLLARAVRNEYVTVFLTYATVFWELCFPMAMLSRRLRTPAVVLGVLFHAGTAYAMGLVTFGWYMVSAYFFLYSDADYRRVWSRLGARLRRGSLVVIYDDSRARSGRSVAAWKRIDPIGLLRFESSRDPEIRARHDLDRGSPHGALEARSPDGRVYRSSAALAAMLMRTSLLPLGILLAIARRLGFERTLDRWFASI